MQTVTIVQALIVYMISEWLLVAVLEYELSLYPAFAVFCQQLFIVVIMGVAVAVRFITVQFHSPSELFQFSVLALLMCMSVLLRGQRQFNQFLWLAEFSVRPIFTIFFVYFLSNKCISLDKIGIIVAFSSGVCMAMWDGLEVSSVGFVLIMCATLAATVAEYTLSETLFETCRVSVASLLLWVSVMTLLAMLPMIFIQHEQNEVIDRWDEIGYEMVVAVFPSCVLAFARNYSMLILVQQIGSVYIATVTSSLAPLQVLAHEKYSPSFTTVNYIGIVLILVTLLPYHFFEIKDSLRRRT